MRTIKFVSDDVTQKKFSNAVRQNVNNYFKEKKISTKGNLTLAFQTIAMLTFYIAPFIILLIVPMSAWLALPLTIIMGIGMAGDRDVRNA